jgi:hypothetical protein
MSRYDKETIRAKLEWEGSDGIEWFEPSEVPLEMKYVWDLARCFKRLYDSCLAEIYDWLEDE